MQKFNYFALETERSISSTTFIKRRTKQTLIAIATSQDFPAEFENIP